MFGCGASASVNSWSEPYPDDVGKWYISPCSSSSHHPSSENASIEDGVDGLDGSIEDGVDGLEGSVEDGVNGLEGSVEDGVDGLEGSIEGGVDGLEGYSSRGDSSGIDGSGRLTSVHPSAGCNSREPDDSPGFGRWPKSVIHSSLSSSTRFPNMVIESSGCTTSTSA